MRYSDNYKHKYSDKYKHTATYIRWNNLPDKLMLIKYNHKIIGNTNSYKYKHTVMMKQLAWQTDADSEPQQFPPWSPVHFPMPWSILNFNFEKSCNFDTRAARIPRSYPSSAGRCGQCIAAGSHKSLPGLWGWCSHRWWWWWWCIDGTTTDDYCAIG